MRLESTCVCARCHVVATCQRILLVDGGRWLCMTCAAILSRYSRENERDGGYGE